MNDDAGVITKDKDAGANIELRVCTAMEEAPNRKALDNKVKADFTNLLGGRMASQATAWSAARISRSTGLAKRRTSSLLSGSALNIELWTMLRA